MMFWAIQTIYFLKALGPRISKLILPSVSYTNTQIQHITKCQKDPTSCIFLKRGLFRGCPLSLAQLYKVQFLTTSEHFLKLRAYPILVGQSEVCGKSESKGDNHHSSHHLRSRLEKHRNFENHLNFFFKSINKLKTTAFSKFVLPFYA